MVVSASVAQTSGILAAKNQKHGMGAMLRHGKQVQMSGTIREHVVRLHVKTKLPPAVEFVSDADTKV